MTTNHSPHSPHQPHSLESLVPPLELCRKIPKGSFEDSAMAWSVSCAAPFVQDRTTIEGAIGGKIIAPAPTLQEILAELHNYHLEKFGKTAPCEIVVKRDPENFSPYFADYSPVIAALKLYLELNSTPSIPSIPSIPSSSRRSDPSVSPEVP